MRTMSYTASRSRLGEVLDSVIDDCEEVVITRTGREPVVVVPLSEYTSLKETVYLLGSAANARRIFDSIEQLDAGEGEEHDLIDSD